MDLEDLPVHDKDLPDHINYLLSSFSNHDCFFNVGPESGPRERIGGIKILLISHSSVLRKMLVESPLAEKGDISVIDSDPESFRCFLKCIYGGTDIVGRKMSFEKCLCVLYLCEKYLALDVKEKLTSVMLETYHPLLIENVMISISNPTFLESMSSPIEEAVSNYVQNNTEEVCNHKSFFELDSNGVLFIVKQDKFSTKEINVWKAVLNWAEKKVESGVSEDLRSCLEDILKHIRFSTMDANDFCKFVVPREVLTSEETFDICRSIGTGSIPKINKDSKEIFDRFKKPTQEVKFTYVLNNIKELHFNKKSTSPEFKLGTYTWTITLSLSQDKDWKEYLGIYLNNIFYNDEREWCAKVKFSIINHSGRPNLTKDMKAFNGRWSWGVDKFISFKEITNTEMGYIKNNSIEIVVHVELNYKS